jgi:hypothetical protein
MRGWLFIILCVIAAPCWADVAFILRSSSSTDQYFCGWTEDDVARLITISCDPFEEVDHFGDILAAGFDDEPPGDWTFWAGIYGVPLQTGTGCSFAVKYIDGDPRGALLTCL